MRLRDRTIASANPELCMRLRDRTIASANPELCMRLRDRTIALANPELCMRDRTIASANPELCMRLCKFYRYRHRHGSSVSEELLRLLRLGLFLGSQSQKIVA
jgi:hypothetical protein